jgi:siroheme synthase-like protein
MPSRTPTQQVPIRVLDKTATETVQDTDERHDTGQKTQSRPERPWLLPVFRKLEGRKVVLVGGGQVAALKVRSLLTAGALVTVIAPEVSDEIGRAPVTIVASPFRPRHLHGAWFVVAAANREVNQRVREAAERHRLFVNVVDEADQATAYLGGVVRRGDVTVAVSTGGKVPALAALVREALEGLLPDDVRRWGEIARGERLRWRATRVAISDRRPLLFEILERHYRSPDGDRSRCLIPESAGSAPIPLVVDSTLTTPALIRPGSWGADIVVHSTTKFINGHATALGGAVIDTGRYDWQKGKFSDVALLARKAGRLAFLAQLRLSAYRDLGGCPAPLSSHQMLQGLETLSVRMQAHCENAGRLANALATRPDVAWVNYPGLARSRFQPLVNRLFSGLGGGVLTLGLGTERRAFRFLNALKRATLAANLGETRTLVIHPASTIFADYGPEERASMGVGDDLVRISVGLEPEDEILQDVIQALEVSAREQT